VGMIARTVSWRVAEALSVHLAGATDMAIEEIVRRRGQSIKNSVEDERVLHPEFTPTDLARSLVYQRSNVSAIAGAVSSLPGAFPGIGSGAEIGAALADTAALIYSQVALTLAVAAAFDHDLGAHDARAADVRIVLALDVGAAKFGERGIVEFADGGTLDPHDPELSEELTRELGADGRPAHRAPARAHPARARDPVRSRRGHRRGCELQGHAPHRPHGTALFRLHRDRHRARLSVRPRASRGTRAAPTLGG